MSNELVVTILGGLALLLGVIDTIVARGRSLAGWAIIALGLAVILATNVIKF